MNNALAGQQFRSMSGIGKLSAYLLFQPAGSLLLHPIIVLPAFVYLLGGSPGQVAWYAIVAALGNGIAAPLGSVVAAYPRITRPIAGVLLLVQGIGFLVIAFAALRAGSVSNDSLLTVSMTGFLLLILPASVLLRIVEQSREYARAAVAPAMTTLLASSVVVLTGLGVWRLTDTGTLDSPELFGRLLLPGALTLIAATWLGMLPILTSDHLPYPARTLPSTDAPRFFSNPPLMRYAGYRLLDGLSRFTDPFLLVAVSALLAPGIIWWGAAVLAFAVGEAAARLVMSSSRRPNARTAVVFGTFLRAMTLILIAFLPTIADTALFTDWGVSENWSHWTFVFATFILGAGYWLSHAGNAEYIQSITPPTTREVTRAVIGVVVMITAFAPVAAIRMLDSISVDILLRFGAGATVTVLLASAMIVRPYSSPGRRSGSWSLRRQSAP